jgi:hypothetical protein
MDGVSGILLLSSVILGLLMAMLRFWASAQSKADQARIQTWFGKQREFLTSSKWAYIPKALVRSFLGIEHAIINQMSKMFFSGQITRDLKSTTEVLDSDFNLSADDIPQPQYARRLAIVLGVVFMILFTMQSPSDYYYIMYSLFVLALFSINAILFEIRSENVVISYNKGMFAMSVFFAIINTMFLIMYMNFLFTLDHFTRMVVLSYMVVFLTGMIFPISWIIFRQSGLSAAYAASFSVSMILSEVAIRFGEYMAPQDVLQRTKMLFTSNSFFDGLTVLTLMRVFSWSNRSVSNVKIIAAICFCSMLAILFAYFSLYIGLYWSDSPLSPQELFNVLIGRSFDGSYWHFGPHFFLMHTTFIPIILFILSLIFVWSAKLFVDSFEWFLERGMLPDINPVNLAASFVGLLAAICAGTAYVFSNIFFPS